VSADIRAFIAANEAHALSHGNEASRNKARATLGALSSELKISEETLERILGEISNDPYTLFLRKIWC
jgi:AraC-like DNA-binding protein